MTLPIGNYGVTIQKTRLVVKEENEEHFIEMTTKVGKQLLSIRLPVLSIKWKKDKRGGGKAKQDESWYTHLENKSNTKKGERNGDI